MNNALKRYTVGEFKGSFSEILSFLKKGEKVTVCYGKKKEPVGLLIPFPSPKKRGIRLGLMEGKAKLKILPGFKMTDEELFGI